MARRPHLGSFVAGGVSTVLAYQGWRWGVYEWSSRGHQELAEQLWEELGGWQYTLPRFEHCDSWKQQEVRATYLLRLGEPPNLESATVRLFNPTPSFMEPLGLYDGVLESNAKALLKILDQQVSQSQNCTMVTEQPRQPVMLGD